MTINAAGKELRIFPSMDGQLHSKFIQGDYTDIVVSDPPFETTFDLGVDWNASVTAATGIANLERWQYKTTTAGKWEEIVVAAQRPGSLGARGFRHWIGDGKNDYAGGVRHIFETPQTELWVRWYMKYPLGFTWSSLNYHKLVVISSGSSPSSPFNGNFTIPEFISQAGSHKFNVWSAYEGNHVSANDKGFNYVMGGTTGDGNWHLYECHVKLSTGSANGIVEGWIDEELLVQDTSVYFGPTVESYQFRAVCFGSNAASPNNGGDVAIDYDDIVISNTGYIGPA